MSLVFLRPLAPTFASGFIRDYTQFSLYYAVDILLTLTLVSFLPHILREAPHDLH